MDFFLSFKTIELSRLADLYSKEFTIRDLQDLDYKISQMTKEELFALKLTLPNNTTISLREFLEDSAEQVPFTFVDSSQRDSTSIQIVFYLLSTSQTDSNYFVSENQKD